MRISPAANESAVSAAEVETSLALAANLSSAATSVICEAISAPPPVNMSIRSTEPNDKSREIKSTVRPDVMSKTSSASASNTPACLEPKFMTVLSKFRKVL